MKKIWIIITTALVTLVLVMGAGFVLWTKLLPLNHLLQTTSIQRVGIDNRTLQSVVQNVLDQVQAKKGVKVRVLFSPERLGNNTRETSGGVFGNPPVEGTADEALSIVANDYRCRYGYVDEGTILFYHIEGD